MPAEAGAVSARRLVWWHDRILAALACSLCVSAQVKFAEIQLLELLYAFDICLVTLWLLIHPEPVRVFRPLVRLGLQWALLAVFAILLAMIALQGDFYPSENISALKQPLVVTLARVAELFLDVFAMLYLAARCREDGDLCRFALLLYYRVGIAGCVYGWLSEVAMLAHVKLGGSDGFRMTGFNNEGGPFGVYLVSALVVGLTLYQKRWIRLRSFVPAAVLMVLSMVLAQAKAALLEIVVFGALIALLWLRPLKAVLVVTVAVTAGATVFTALGFTQRVLQYAKAADQYRTVSLVRRYDYNVVAGRVAGLYLAPKMLAAHPLAGIGLGNYPIVRNDPEYRRGSSIIDITLDAPSLGPLDYMVDLGLPLFLYLSCIQVAPAVTMLRRGGVVGAVALVLVLPVSMWFGAHLNLTYMWIAAGLGLAVFYQDHDSSAAASGQSFQVLRPSGTGAADGGNLLENRV